MRFTWIQAILLTLALTTKGGGEPKVDAQVPLSVAQDVSAESRLPAGTGRARPPGGHELEQDFIRPPAAARPWVYWYWINGNITRAGITADLEAMQRVGIGGVLIMEVTLGTPAGPLEFASPPWREHLKFAIAEAARLGLEVNLANAGGWCGSGGPWITPELGQKIVAWSETHVTGGRKFEGTLPRPKTYADWFRDIAVLAVPTPAGDDVTMAGASPKITGNDGRVVGEAAKLSDGNPDTQVILPLPREDQPQSLQFEFAEPYLARAFALSLAEPQGENLEPGPAIVDGVLEVSDNGRDFRTVCAINLRPGPFEAGFDAVAARWFRVQFTRTSPRLNAIALGEMDLSPRYRIAGIRDKAAFSDLFAHVRLRAHWPESSAALTVPRSRILDLSALMDASGKLTWDAPEGKWTFLRIGYAPSGKENYPAPAGGRGLECDKLDPAGAEAQFAGLLSNLLADSEPFTGRTIVATHIDSWEVGTQNWAANFRAEFRQRRGYDLLPFLPVITGRVVDSLEISERFLWDFRQTIADLLVANYAGRFRTLANKHGLRLSIEAYDHVPASEVVYGGQADEPMGEFFAWNGYDWGSKTYTVTGMTSAAHVYGKRIIGAEAFTSSSNEKYLAHPGNLKQLGDWAFSLGVNRFNFHTYAHQPWVRPERAPGISLWWWGLHYQRTLTWWEQSGPWHDYLARCQHLLRQGLFVADLCYLEPEGSPMRASPPASVRPVGLDQGRHAFDCCPPEVVLNRMTVRDGRLVLPDGMSYRLLVLPEVATMTPELLRKLKELVTAGATVVGTPPVKAPGLTDYPQCDAEVSRLTRELWGDCDGRKVTERRLGLGRVIRGRTPAQVLADLGVGPDFHFRSAAGVDLNYLHRTSDGTEIYFLANKNKHAGEALCSFRVSGLRPELWSPVTGRITRPAVYEAADGQVTLPIQFDPDGSIFVVFRADRATEPDRLTAVTRNGETVLAAIPVTNLPPEEDMEAITDTFTMALWARPTAVTGLPREAGAAVPVEVVRNFAIYPPPRNEPRAEIDRYPSEEGHSSAGLAVGTNGVCIYEQSTDYFTPLYEYAEPISHAPLLVHAAPLAGWTHLTVVFRQGVPQLYIDGRLVREGLGAIGQIHPGVVGQHTVGNLTFTGETGEYRVFNRELTAAEIAQLPAAMWRPAALPPTQVIELTRTEAGTMSAFVRQPGVYELKTAGGGTRSFTVKDVPAPLIITGPWQVVFASGLGAPAEIILDRLASWTEHADPGVKFFSGAAIYHQVIEVPADWIASNRRLQLDLGNVGMMAEVTLNGRNLGLVWKTPFRVDVTGAVRAGANTLEVKVINTSMNRQIGDEFLPEDSERKPDGTLKQWPAWLEAEQPSPAGRFTFATTRLLKKDDPLADSGLLGPVVLHAVECIELK